MRDYPYNPKINYQKAIFLDRDGTINVDTHYPHKISDLIVPESSFKAMELFNQLLFDLIVITNQSGIALEYYKEKDMSLFNQELKRRVQERNGRINGFYYCPHLERSCDCSKPKSGMLLEASSDFQIELSESYMIGDKLTDILCGKNVGCKTILIKSPKNNEGIFEEIIPDFVVNDLYEAALIIERGQISKIKK